MDNQSEYRSDLELLSREITWDSTPTLNKFFLPAVSATVGYVSAVCLNFFQRRPLHSGIQRHLLLAGFGLMGGMYIDKYLDNRNAKRDAVLRHYITLHPEEFQPEERKKFKDVLQPWIPIR